MHNKTLLTVFKIRSEWLVNSVMFIQYSFAQWWSDSREYLSSDGASSLQFVADEIFTIDTIGHSQAATVGSSLYCSTSVGYFQILLWWC